MFQSFADLPVVDPDDLDPSVQALIVTDGSSPTSTFRHLIGRGCLVYLRRDTGLEFRHAHPNGELDILGPESRCGLCGSHLLLCGRLPSVGPGPTEP